MAAGISVHAGSICERVLQYRRQNVHWKYCRNRRYRFSRSRSLRSDCYHDFFCGILGRHRRFAFAEHPAGTEKRKKSKRNSGQLLFIIKRDARYHHNPIPCLKDHLLVWFGASETVFPYADEYITVYLLGTVFALLSTGMNQFIICQGFAKVGMKSVLLGAVLNILLDPVFIFVLDMGVAGAAVATVISQMASCVYVLRFLFSNRPMIKITFGGYDLKVMGQVLLLGLTPFLIIAFDNILIISLNATIQKYGGAGRGDMLLTCNTILQSFMLIVTMPLSGITGGTQTILGYNYGAKRPDRIKKAQKHILVLALAFTTIMFVVAQLLPQYFTMIFTRDPEYIQMTVRAIRIYSLMIIPLAVQYTIVDGFTGMGIAKVAISLSTFRKLIYFAGVFLIPLWFDITNVFYTEPISDLISAIVSSVVYIRLIGKIEDGTL